jgi:hypothetical protein
MPTTDSSSDVSVLSLLDFEPECEQHEPGSEKCGEPVVGFFQCRACRAVATSSAACRDVAMWDADRAARMSRVLICQRCGAFTARFLDLFTWTPFGGAR